jgi:hypothetical protein
MSALKFNYDLHYYSQKGWLHSTMIGIVTLLLWIWIVMLLEPQLSFIDSAQFPDSFSRHRQLQQKGESTKTASLEGPW